MQMTSFAPQELFFFFWGGGGNLVSTEGYTHKNIFCITRLELKTSRGTAFDQTVSLCYKLPGAHKAPRKIDSVKVFHQADIQILIVAYEKRTPRLVWTRCLH